MAELDGKPKNILARLADDVGERLADPVRVFTFVTSVALIVLASFGLVQVLSGKWSVLEHLRDQDYARGLITLAITFVSLGLATVLVFAALVRDTEEDRFRRAREVFGVLAGILGTIVGFYFGSADKRSDRLKIASLRSRPGQVRAIVLGGKPPYRYSIAVGGTEKVKSKQTDDGVIEEAIPEAKPGAVVKLSIRDRDEVADDATASVGDAPASPSPAPTPTPSTPPSQ